MRSDAVAISNALISACGVSTSDSICIRYFHPPRCSRSSSIRATSRISSGPRVLGSMMPWKRLGAPNMIASMSPLKNGEWILLGRTVTTLLAEVERVERLDHHLVALWAFEFVGTGVFEVRHHMVDRRFNGVGGGLMQLHVVAGIGHLGARDDEAGAVIEYVHGSCLQSPESLARSPRLFDPCSRLGACLVPEILVMLVVD